MFAMARPVVVVVDDEDASRRALARELGGARRNHLFICASSSLYSILVNFNGARYPR
jgi:hypothetical protein